MKALLDTSVLVPALVEAHPRHAQAFAWLQNIRRAEIQAVIAVHSIVETYAVLSSLPGSPRIAPSAAWTLVEHSVLPSVRAVELSTAEVQQVVQRVSRLGLIGGIVHDALIAEAAIKSGAECVVTLNAGDFRRVMREGPLQVREL